MDAGKDDDWEALERRAADGDVDAMIILGALAEESGDLEAAREWYLKAAELGDSTAMANLGVLAAESGDLEAGREWFLKAAENGDENAAAILNQLGE